MDERIKTISSRELKDLLASREDYFLIDVRDPEEYEEGHIERSILIPLYTLSERIKGIKKDKALITYCRTGRRSKTAAEMLKVMGYTNVCHLEGGIEAWLTSKNG